MSHLQAICQDDVGVHGPHVQVVDEGTLNSVRNIFQGGELGLNLITHLQRKWREVKAGDQDGNWRLYRVTEKTPWVPNGRQTTGTNTQDPGGTGQSTAAWENSRLHPKRTLGLGEKCVICGLIWHSPSASK